MQGGLLANTEVFELLGEQRSRRADKDITDPSVKHFHSTVRHYLEANTDEGHRSMEAAAAIKKLLDAENFGLTEAETMQLLNLCPQYQVEVHMVSCIPASTHISDVDRII